jgi:hypothetical protein
VAATVFARPYNELNGSLLSCKSELTGSYKVNRQVHFWDAIMRTVLLALTLALSTVPAFAGGFGVDLPTLTWPEDGQATTSTKGCVEAPTGSTAPCK